MSFVPRTASTAALLCALPASAAAQDVLLHYVLGGTPGTIASSTILHQIETDPTTIGSSLDSVAMG